MKATMAHRIPPRRNPRREIRFGSMCSGISAASVAWNPLGWRAAWFHEILPWCSALLAGYYPYAVNHGDMLKAPQRVRAGELEAPDIVCGGTPCQAFSLGGALHNKPRSLQDARGNLTLTFCEVANEVDERRAAAGDPPCVVFWENVLGVLTTKDNAFGCLLAGLAGERDALRAPGGGWTNAGYVLGPQRAVAWRVFDAQHFGLASRRPRVIVVASARDGFDPATVLFESEGGGRDAASRGPAQSQAAGTLSAGPGARLLAFGGGNTSGPIEVGTCLTHHGVRLDFDTETFVLDDGRVRRLLPVEYERLQGFPEGYTAVSYRGRPAADGPRYKAIGNSWAIPCVRWVGQRIDAALRAGEST